MNKEAMKCAICGRTLGRHKALTLNCPLSASRFTHFHATNVYTPKLPKVKGQ